MSFCPKKQLKQLQFLYQWLQIARKPNQSLRADIKLVFDLIGIPTSESEISILQKIINPEKNKPCLTKQDFINCFVIQEECRKPKQKELVKAFKYVSEDRESITVDQLKGYFQQEGIDSDTATMIINQLDDCVSNGVFDYKRFASTVYEPN